jgi:3-isopropylmalate dehydrogenase
MPAANGPLNLLVLPADGIGPEITATTVAVLEEVNRLFGLGLVLHRMDVGLKALDLHGSTFPDPVWEAVRQAEAVVLGPCSRHAYPPLEEGGVGVSGMMRRRLDLFANIRPARSRPGVPPALRQAFRSRHRAQNTEGFYATATCSLANGEYMPTPDVALGTRR